MNTSQNKAFRMQLLAILNSVHHEHPDDQIFSRVVNQRTEDKNIWADVEIRIENPTTGYESGWYWINAIGVGPRGRII